MRNQPLSVHLPFLQAVLHRRYRSIRVNGPESHRTFSRLAHLLAFKSVLTAPNDQGKRPRTTPQRRKNSNPLQTSRKPNSPSLHLYL